MGAKKMRESCYFVNFVFFVVDILYLLEGREICERKIFFLNY